MTCIHIYIDYQQLSLSLSLSLFLSLSLYGRMYRCFELLGIDVMITDTFEPVLMEVNHSPNLTTGSPLDLRIKTGAVSHCLRMLGVRSDEAVRWMVLHWTEYFVCLLLTYI